MDVNCFHHVIQYGGCQFVHVEILMHLADEPFNVLCLFFLSVNFLIQLQQLFPQFFLFLFVIVREHLKSAVRKFTICVIFINTLKQSVKFRNPAFRLHQLPPLCRQLPFCVCFLLCAHSLTELFFMVGYTSNR